MYSIQEIRERLHEEYISLDCKLPGIEMKNSSASDEDIYDESVCITKDFELLIRGAGTMYFERKNDSANIEDLVRHIAQDCGASIEGYKFWREL